MEIIYFRLIYEVPNEYLLDNLHEILSNNNVDVIFIQ